MKNLYFLAILCLSALPTFAQNTSAAPTSSTVDPRIVEVFGDQLQTLVLNDPFRLRDLNDILFERTEIVESPFDPTEKYKKLSEVPLFNYYNAGLTRDAVFNKDTFNVLKYDMPFFSKYDVVYRIDDTNYILVLHPQNLRR